MIWSVVIAVVSLVGSVVMQKQMAKDMQDKQAGFMVSKTGGSHPLRIIYGKRRVGTDNVWKGISRQHMSQSTSEADSFYTSPSEGIAAARDDEDYLHRLDVWCQGPVQSVGNFRIDHDKLSHIRFNGKPYVRVLNKHGADSQTMFSGLISGSSDIDSSMKGNGVAYSWSRFLYTATSPEFQGEPNVTAEIEGLKVWDPRANPNDTTVKSYSDNPALCLLDYLLADYGRNLDVQDIHLDSFISAANACDSNVNTPTIQVVGTAGDYYNPETGEYVTLQVGDSFPWHRVGQASTSRGRYSCNLILESSNSTMDNAKEILKCMKGSLPFIQGQYKLVLEDVGASVMSFDDSNILGSISLGYADRSKRLNRCTVKFPNENKAYKPDTVSWPAVASVTHSGYKTLDNGEDLHTEVELTGVTDYYQARDLAEFIVRDSRTQEFVEFKAQPSALILEVGDVIQVTNDILDLNSKKYRVRSLSLNSDLTVNIKAQHYDSSVYPWNLDDDDSEPVNLNIAPSAFDTPAPITGFAAASATELNQDGTASSKIAAVWNSIVSGTVAVDVIEIGYKKSSDSEYTWTTLPAGTVSHVFVGLPDLTDFNLTIRYRNTLGKYSIDTTTNVGTADANTDVSSEDLVAQQAAADAQADATAANAAAVQAASDAAAAQATASAAATSAGSASAAAAAAQSAADNAAVVAASKQTAAQVATAIANDTTEINGSRIVTGTLDGSDITATSVITAGSGNDVAKLSGSDSTYRLWIGHSSSSSAPFKVNKNGEVTIKSATSGERLEILADVIKVYDAAGQLRVKLGNLS